MSNYLMREGAPFGDEMWKAIDEAVVSTARRQLVARRILTLVGPLGIGAVSALAGSSMPALAQQRDAVLTPSPLVLPLQMLSADFTLSWWQIEATTTSGVPLDLSAGMEAASRVAFAEDDLLFNGNGEYGIEGLLNTDGHQAMQSGPWAEGLNGFTAVLEATLALTRASIARPYVLLVGARRFGDLHHPADPVELVIDRVKRLVDGVFVSPALPDSAGLVLANGPQYMDMVIGQDMISAYLGPDGLDHNLRVLESLALRVKDPRAIVTIE